VSGVVEQWLPIRVIRAIRGQTHRGVPVEICGSYRDAWPVAGSSV